MIFAVIQAACAVGSTRMVLLIIYMVTPGSEGCQEECVDMGRGEEVKWCARALLEENDGIWLEVHR